MAARSCHFSYNAMLVDLGPVVAKSMGNVWLNRVESGLAARRHAFLSRTAGWSRDNPTVSHRILAPELRKLEDAGIVRRTARSGYPLHVDYDLTASGRRLVPLIDALGSWWERTEDDRTGQVSPMLETYSGTARVETITSAS